MSDNLRRFIAVRKALLKLYRTPSARQGQHLRTLAALIAGIVGSKRVSLPAIATHVPEATQPSSREQKYRRFVANEQVSYSTYFMPFITDVLATLSAARSLEIVFDGSMVGRGCVALVASVIYKNRALPIAWMVRQGRKGHCAESMHLELLAEVQALLPASAQVVFLGDGEFDGIRLQDALKLAGWSYVCRTAKNRHLHSAWSRRCGDEVFTMAELDVGTEIYVSLPQAGYSATGPPRTAVYGPVHAILWHEPGHKEAVYLITNMALAREAIWFYRKRFRNAGPRRIETMFSDQKSRGFHLHKSRLRDPKRLARLLMAVSLAYIWMVYLGTLALRSGLQAMLHRADRCDLSLFQLGIRLLEHMLNHELRLRVQFVIIPDDTPYYESVR
jgi:hypothetical protein